MDTLLPSGHVIHKSCRGRRLGNAWTIAPETCSRYRHSPRGAVSTNACRSMTKFRQHCLGCTVARLSSRPLTNLPNRHNHECLHNIYQRSRQALPRHLLAMVDWILCPVRKPKCPGGIFKPFTGDEPLSSHPICHGRCGLQQPGRIGIG